MVNKRVGLSLRYFLNLSFGILELQERERKMRKARCEEHVNTLKKRIKLHQEFDEWTQKETAKTEMDKMV